MTEITRIFDFKILLEMLYSAHKSYYSNPNDTNIVNTILSISEPILNRKNSTDENLKQYSTVAISLVDLIKLGKATDKDFEVWYQRAKINLAEMFISLSYDYLNKDNCFPDSDDELDKKLLEFFEGDFFIFRAAHYVASRRYALKDPMLCYKNTMNDFEKEPELLQKIFANKHYCYSPEKIKDAIYNVCPICDSEEAEPFYCADQAILDHNSFSPAKLWMKCGGCGNLYAYNFPVWNMGEINGHYTSKTEGQVLTPRNQLVKYSNIFNHIKEFNPGTKYLEVGVGNGEMLAVALEMGYDVSAVEICKEDCENISGALGVDIVWSDFLKYKSEQKYDVIIMGDILEHVSKPIDALQKAYELLNDNGILWLSTPNFNSAFTRMRKFTDPMWNQKNHFTYFSYEGLEPFLKKNGFTIKRYDVSERYNGSMELILQK